MTGSVWTRQAPPFFLAALLIPRNSATVIVVGPKGAFGLPLLGVAIAAAQCGDIFLVRAWSD